MGGGGGGFTVDTTIYIYEEVENFDMLSNFSDSSSRCFSVVAMVILPNATMAGMDNSGHLWQQRRWPNHGH